MRVFLNLFISLVIGRFSLHTKGDPCLLFRLTAIIPPLGMRFSIRFLVLSFYKLYPVLKVCYLFWHCLGALFSLSFAYSLAVFSSLQMAWWVVLSVGTASYTSVPYLSLYLFPLVVLTPVSDFQRVIIVVAFGSFTNPKPLQFD